MVRYHSDNYCLFALTKDPMTTAHSPIPTALDTVHRNIIDCETRFKRTAGSVRLIAVSKTKPAAHIQAAIACGQRDFGENYLDEALEKIAQLSGSDCCWHFIGSIQSNKTRHVAAHFDWAHCIDREKIARRLSQQRPVHLPPLNVCIQVNIDAEASKSGVSADEALLLADKISPLPNIRLRGLMAIPSLAQNLDEQRKPFARMRALFETIQHTHAQMDTLSMGMSGDLAAAIAEGATMVRIGTAIFGARPVK